MGVSEAERKSVETLFVSLLLYKGVSRHILNRRLDGWSRRLDQQVCKLFCLTARYVITERTAAGILGATPLDLSKFILNSNQCLLY